MYMTGHINTLTLMFQIGSTHGFQESQNPIDYIREVDSYYSVNVIVRITTVLLL